MAELEDFLKTLQETVAVNKLSTSRVDRIKTGAATCFHDPSAATSILKLHLRSSSSTKVSSLYLFDAIARHAKDVVKKQGAGQDAGDARAPPGSDAIDGTTEALVAGAEHFLSWASRVASEIALDTMRSVGREQQEKVRKVIDIWARAATFDSDMLRELQRSVERLGNASSSASASASISSRHRERIASSSSSSTRTALAKRSATPPTDPRDAKRRPNYPLPPSLTTDMSGRGASDSPASVSAPAQVGLPANLLAMLGGANVPASSSSSLPPAANLAEKSGSASAAPPASGGDATGAAPMFDMSQLTMLHQLAAPRPNAAAATPMTPLSVAAAVGGGAAPPGPPPPRPAPPHASRPRDERSRSPTARTSARTSERASRWSDTPSTNAAATAVAADTAAGGKPKDGLSSLDLSTFDPTDAESWSRVGRLFENTYGYKPSNQDVMAVVMGMPPMSMAMGMGMGIGMGMGMGMGMGGMGDMGGMVDMGGMGGGTGYGSLSAPAETGWVRGQQQRWTSADAPTVPSGQQATWGTKPIVADD
ncbi:hypothetical protein ACQY0O_003760 [Thecaphora frezii]